MSPARLWSCDSSLINGTVTPMTTLLRRNQRFTPPPVRTTTILAVSRRSSFPSSGYEDRRASLATSTRETRPRGLSPRIAPLNIASACKDVYRRVTNGRQVTVSSSKNFAGTGPPGRFPACEIGIFVMTCGLPTYTRIAPTRWTDMRSTDRLARSPHFGDRPTTNQAALSARAGRRQASAGVHST